MGYSANSPDLMTGEIARTVVKRRARREDLHPALLRCYAWPSGTCSSLERTRDRRFVEEERRSRGPLAGLLVAPIPIHCPPRCWVFFRSKDANAATPQIMLAVTKAPAPAITTNSIERTSRRSCSATYRIGLHELEENLRGQSRNNFPATRPIAPELEVAQFEDGVCFTVCPAVWVA